MLDVRTEQFLLKHIHPEEFDAIRMWLHLAR